MSQGAAWATAQVPFLVAGPAGYVPTHPSEKASQSEKLAAQIAAFRKAGGKVEVVTTPTGHAQTNTSSRTRRTAKA